jgi:hypothetical protein
VSTPKHREFSLDKAPGEVAGECRTCAEDGHDSDDTLAMLPASSKSKKSIEILSGP